MVQLAYGPDSSRRTLGKSQSLLVGEYGFYDEALDDGQSKKESEVLSGLQVLLGKSMAIKGLSCAQAFPEEGLSGSSKKGGGNPKPCEFNNKSAYNQGGRG